MANNNRFAAPKQWTLSENETLNSFEAWKNNLLFSLQLDNRFTAFLANDFTWNKKSRNAADTRGLTADAGENGLTAAQKCIYLEMLLGQVANFAPIISRRQIINDSTSINSVWQTIKLHYSLNTTGGNFIDFVSIKYTPPERPETLFQRMLSFIENNLLSPGCGITHNGETVTEFEDFTPTVENLVVLLWLREVHPNLPTIVKQEYGSDLRAQSLSSLKPEISSALPCLIEKAKLLNDSARVMRSSHERPFTQQKPGYPRTSHARPQNFTPTRRAPRSCPLCKAHNRPDSDHFLSTCRHLPDADRRFMTKARQVVVEDDTESAEDYQLDDQDEHFADVTPRIGRVNVRSSPQFNTFFGHCPLTVTLDTGAETNLIRESLVKTLGCPISPSSQVAFQADGSTPLNIKGEIHTTLSRDGLELSFSGLVVDTLDVDILAGVPFMEENDVAVRPKTKMITVGDTHKFTYSSTTPSYSALHRSSVLRTTSKATVWPGEYLELHLSDDSDSCVAIEPHSPERKNQWPSPNIYSVVGGHVRIPNTTSEPQTLAKHAHIGHVSAIFCPTEKRPHLQTVLRYCLP